MDDAPFRWSKDSAHSIELAESRARRALEMGETSAAYTLLSRLYTPNRLYQKAIAEAERPWTLRNALALRLNPLYNRHPHPLQRGHLADAGALGQPAPDAPLHVCRNARPTSNPSLFPRPSKARVNLFANYCPLELGEHAHHLQQGLTCWRHGVHLLLVQVEVDTQHVDLVEEVYEMLEGTAQPIDAPCRHQVKFTTSSGLEHRVECGAFIPEPGKGQQVPQSNDVDLDGRGLIYLVDRLNGLDVLEFTG